MRVSQPATVASHTGHDFAVEALVLCDGALLQHARLQLRDVGEGTVIVDVLPALARAQRTRLRCLRVRVATLPVPDAVECAVRQRLVVGKLPGPSRPKVWNHVQLVPPVRGDGFEPRLLEQLQERRLADLGCPKQVDATDVLQLHF